MQGESLKHALVTGASSGIGRAIAKQLVERGYLVVCCARSEIALMELSEETQGRCRPLVLDLSEQSASSSVEEYCITNRLTVEVLVNCAGYGAVGHHVRHSPQAMGRMCRLNVNTPTELCALFGRGMRERRRGFILNVSSVAGFLPIPYFANYSACKAFIRSLSDSLHEEMRPYGVKVCCLSPGPVRTRFHANSNPNYAGEENSVFSLTPEAVAEAGLQGLFQGKRSIVPGLANRCCVWLEHFFPRDLVSRFLAMKSEGRKLRE